MIKTISLIIFAVTFSTPLSVLAQEVPRIQIGEGQKEFPESVTSISDGTLFTGSITQGVVFKVAPGAEQSELFIAAPTDGPAGSFGVYADEANGALWVCYADPAVFGGGEALPSVLAAYDLATGEKRLAATFPAGSLCNDIATLPDGTAFAADTAGGRIIRVAAGSGVAEEWLSDPLLAGVDGLSFGPDGVLYVNSVTSHKLLRIELGPDGAAGPITELATSEPLKGPDGMRFGSDGKLYLAENANSRVVEVTIEGDTATIRPLPGPAYNGATAVTIVDDRLHVLETKLSAMGEDTDPGPFFIYTVPLN